MYRKNFKLILKLGTACIVSFILIAFTLWVRNTVRETKKAPTLIQSSLSSDTKYADVMEPDGSANGINIMTAIHMFPDLRITVIGSNGIAHYYNRDKNFNKTENGISYESYSRLTTKYKAQLLEDENGAVVEIRYTISERG